MIQEFSRIHFFVYLAEQGPMVTTRLLTAEDLYQLGPDAPYILVEGELVEVNQPGGIHGEVAGKISANLGMFILTNKLGSSSRTMPDSFSSQIPIRYSDLISHSFVRGD